jgi:hypothetical protein
MQFKLFLLIPVFSLFTGGLVMHLAKNQTVSKPVNDQKTFLLEYTGSLNGYTNMGVGVQIAMDTSIGFRYDVTFLNGSAVLSHVAFFYKFSSPYQLTEYNYLNHRTQTTKAGKPSKGEDLEVLGNVTIDSFTCTHLQKKNQHEQQDYYMSTSVPGFAQLAQKLMGIDPNLKMMAINQTLFNWGGLVRAQIVAVENGGKTTSFNLKLIEAQTGLVFTTKDFEVPSH